MTDRPALRQLAALGRAPFDQAVEAYAATAPGSPQAAAGLRRLREAGRQAMSLNDGTTVVPQVVVEDRDRARLQHLLELYPDHADVADWRAALDSLEAHDGGDDA